MSDTHHIIDDEFNEPEQARKIFIGNLPYEADEGIESLQSLRAYHVLSSITDDFPSSIHVICIEQAFEIQYCMIFRSFFK